MAESVLLPLDGSETAERAIPWAMALARSRECGVTLLEVTEWPPERPARELMPYFSADAVNRIREVAAQNARQYLERIRSRLAAENIPTDVVVAEGQAADVILDTADRVGAIAIAMGMHGYGGLARVLLGSVARQVLRGSHIPVLLVRTPSNDERPQIRRLVVPLDGSTLAEAALSVAVDSAEPGATITLVRVIEPIMTIVAAGIDGATTVVDERATLEVVELAQSYLDRCAEGVRSGSVAISSIVRTGDPVPEIRAVAQETSADLIVMSTHGRSGLSRWFMGSVADELVRDAERPVLVANPRALLTRALTPGSVGEIMERSFTTLSANEVMPTAIRKLLRGRVSGAPVVDASGKLVGLLSEHDILAWHDRYATQLSEDDSLLQPAVYRTRACGETVGSLMSTPAVTIDDRASLDAAVRLFLERGLRRLPVTREGRLVGILARADVLGVLGTALERPADH